jgi:UDP-3-O-[3-hydroxymyristoyl] glucosamine N-acyltransferase
MPKGVKLGNSVEILSNAHIVSAVFGGFTEIGDGSIDALVHIAHNAMIGKNCEITAPAVISGSTTIGDDVWIGPSACISSGLQIGNGAFVSLGAVVVARVPDGGRVYFRMDQTKYERGRPE